jgi:hypothetical protein
MVEVASLFSAAPQDAPFRAQDVAAARRWVPPGFDVKAFWTDVLGSFDASFLGKVNVITKMTRGEIPLEDLLTIRRELDEEVERWNGLFGVEASAAVRARIRRSWVDPREPAAMVALPPGTPDETAAVLLYAFIRVAGVEAVSSEERLELLRRAAEAGPALPDVQRCLAEMTTVMALEATTEERQEALLRDALEWLTRAQRQEPENPRIGEETGYVLSELSALCERDEARGLWARTSESYAVALRGLGRCIDPQKTEHQANVGRALALWHLGQDATEREEKRRTLAESLLHMQRAARSGLGGRNDARFFAGAIALDLAWAEEDTGARRSACETAHACFAASAAAEPDDGALVCYLAISLLGRAALLADDERRQLTRQAVGLFDSVAHLVAADEIGERSGGIELKEARAWRDLAAACAGAERRAAVERAVAAARRALEREPEDEDGARELASALCLAGEAEAEDDGPEQPSPWP